MPYEKLNIADVFIEKIETGNVVEIKLLKDRATLTNLIENYDAHLSNDDMQSIMQIIEKSL